MSPVNESPTNIFDLIEEAYTKGASDIEVCKILKIRPNKFEERYLRDSSFRELIDIGRMLRRAYWMEQGRINLTNPKFNRNMWRDFMYNEFGWSDKSTISTDVKEKSTEELMNELGPTVRKLLELNLVNQENSDSDGQPLN